MKRRLFLSSLAVALSAVALQAGQPALVGVQRRGFFEVTGTPEQCRLFCEAYQSHLWPNWGSSREAKDLLRQCEPLWQTGVGRVSCGSTLCQEALRKTLTQFILGIE